jgi:inosine-uridine nucleoside N-ribohydrolase
MAMSRKIIIDTDPGIDDAMAIFYALSAPELEVIGLTAVFGNSTLQICTRNALKLLEIAERTHIPVYAGAERPLAMPFPGGANFVHGTDSQGDTHLPPPLTAPAVGHAAQFLIDQIRMSPGEITVVALGPLTNIALMMMLAPGIDRHIREIVLMGGNAFAAGNATPTAEANIWNDPEAADMVFTASCPITMIGLDVTHKILMTAEQLDLISTFDNPRAQHLARILPFYRRFYIERHGRDGIHAHDSTTITYLLNPDIFKTVRYPVCVETMGISRGKTWAAVNRAELVTPWKGRQEVTICVDVNASTAIQMELDHHQR